MMERSSTRLLLGLLLLLLCVAASEHNADAAYVFGAYQRTYEMNFEVWRPDDMPPGWFATFDGYVVTQTSPNRWVYGRLSRGGGVIPTDVLVGSVVPSRVPELARAVFIPNEEYKPKRSRTGGLHGGGDGTGGSGGGGSASSSNNGGTDADQGGQWSVGEDGGSGGNNGNNDSDNDNGGGWDK
jgi:hypothetical protein